MPKLAVWARELWAALLEQPEAADAVARVERDLLLIVHAAREVLTTGRMLKLVGALGEAAKEMPRGDVE